jgi:plasmid stabilization system protein ParE
MRITWSEPALANLEDIHEYIGRDAPGSADRFLQRLVASVDPLTNQPRMGRVVPEGDGRHREILVDPYRIIYRVEPHEIYVVTVVHGARDLAALWERLDTDAPTS